jgi:NAD(P)-dependent dehydrogenase (short-subunit alcohol dehydrogenase family)
VAKTIIVAGYGTGISKAVAEKFGAEGFSVALVARNAERLAAGVKELEGKGIKAAFFTADLGEPSAVREVVRKVRSALGPITVLQWNAYDSGAGDLLVADAFAVRRVLDVAVGGLLAAVQEALPDLRGQKEAAILVTNGGLAYSDPNVDAAGVQWNAMGLSMANAAKHKLIGLLVQKLKPDNVYVGEVMVVGSIKGTAWDNGQATIAGSTVADKFWDLYSARTETTVQLK